MSINQTNIDWILPVGLEAHACIQQQAASRQPSGPRTHAATASATAAAAMTVSLQQLKAYAEAAKRDRGCLEKEYKPPVPLPTRGQQFSTMRLDTSSLPTFDRPLLANDGDRSCDSSEEERKLQGSTSKCEGNISESESEPYKLTQLLAKPSMNVQPSLLWIIGPDLYTYPCIKPF